MNDPYLIKPDPENGLTTTKIKGVDAQGNAIDLFTVNERPLSVFLNNREIVTLMTVGDYPELLGLGYLVNQHMINDDDIIEMIEYDAEIDTVVVRTERTTDYEEKLKRKILTSGCGQGTVFGDIMDNLDDVHLPQNANLKTSDVETLLATIKATPSLYQKAGSIHACVLCKNATPLIYMEDVGRHNALDKIAGYMYQHDMVGGDYVIYTTGRMTSEMVIKAVSMGIPILISRSGATHWALELAQKAGLSLISRAKGKRFIALCGTERITFAD